MLTCKQVSKALAEGHYESLPPLKRAALKVHVALCAVCGKYNRQVMVMQDAARHFREKEDELLAKKEADALSQQDKQELKDAIRKAH